MFERFTERARQVVVLAQEEARALKHNYIGTEHILLGLLREEEGLGARVLESLGVTVQRARERVIEIIGAGSELRNGQIPFTPRAKKLLELSLREALTLGHNYIGTEHILLGLVRENDGVAARILLQDFDAGPEKVREEVLRVLSTPAGSELAARQAAGRLVVETRGSAVRRVYTDSPDTVPWAGSLHALLDTLDGEIRDQLGREPDPGDLLLVLACASGTAAAVALRALGTDPDELWAALEHARMETRAEHEALRTEIESARQAKERELEAQHFNEAASFRDQERELTRKLHAGDTPAPADALDEIRRRLGLRKPEDL